jgi:hypothetical protein
MRYFLVFLFLCSLFFAKCDPVIEPTTMPGFAQTAPDTGYIVIDSGAPEYECRMVADLGRTLGIVIYRVTTNDIEKYRDSAAVDWDTCECKQFTTGETK